jgi:hypothetical protein
MKTELAYGKTMLVLVTTEVGGMVRRGRYYGSCEEECVLGEGQASPSCVSSRLLVTMPFRVLPTGGSLHISRLGLIYGSTHLVCTLTGLSLLSPMCLQPPTAER